MTCLKQLTSLRLWVQSSRGVDKRDIHAPAQQGTTTPMWEQREGWEKLHSSLRGAAPTAQSAKRRQGSTWTSEFYLCKMTASRVETGRWSALKSDRAEACLMISPLGKPSKANRQTDTLRSRWLCPLLHRSFCSPLDGQPRRGGQKNEYLKLQSRAATMWDMKLVLWIIHAR